MNPITRLWHWYRDRRIERHALKGYAVREPHRAQAARPIVGLADDARLRLAIHGRRR